MKLAEPLPLPCGVVLANRIAKAAMSERLAQPDRQPTPTLETLYRRWGAGGAGLLITGNVMVDPAALGEPGNVALDFRSDLEPFRRWAAAGKAGGAQVWVQLNHPGRQSPRMLSRQPVAPSAVAMKGMAGAFAPPRALEAGEIEAVIEAFGVAAARVVEAGFDGVQIHAAHGYLVSQFLSAHTNRRDDAWGGDAERRQRFLLAVVDRVRAAVGPQRAVGVKLNSADFQKGGFSEADSMAVVQALAARGVDLLEISGGTYERPQMFAETLAGAAESTQRREAFFLDYAEKVRGVTSMPLMLTGGFRTAAAMEAALASGAIDVVGQARPLAVEPDLPARVLAGAAEGAVAVRLHTGIQLIDSIVTGAWYQLQMQRLSENRPVAPRLSRLRACGWYVRTSLFARRYRTWKPG